MKRKIRWYEALVGLLSFCVFWMGGAYVTNKLTANVYLQVLLQCVCLGVWSILFDVWLRRPIRVSSLKFSIVLIFPFLISSILFTYFQMGKLIRDLIFWGLVFAGVVVVKRFLSD